MFEMPRWNLPASREATGSRSCASKRTVPSGRRFGTLPVVICLMLFLLVSAGPADAACARGATVNCIITAGAMTKRECTATVMCNAPAFMVTRWTAASAGLSPNVSQCNPVAAAQSTTMSPTWTFMLIARAMTTAATPRTCNWTWKSLSGFGTVSTVASGSFAITNADGLPVELMEFSVESDDQPEATDEDPSD